MVRLCSFASTTPKKSDRSSSAVRGNQAPFPRHFARRRASALNTFSNKNLFHTSVGGLLIIDPPSAALLVTIPLRIYRHLSLSLPATSLFPIPSWHNISLCLSFSVSPALLRHEMHSASTQSYELIFFLMLHLILRVAFISCRKLCANPPLS